MSSEALNPQQFGDWLSSLTDANRKAYTSSIAGGLANLSASPKPLGDGRFTERKPKRVKRLQSTHDFSARHAVMEAQVRGGMNLN